MISNLLLDVSSSTIDWSRAQFALTAIYHWLFVPLTLGLAVIMAIMETCYYRTKDSFWKDTTVFWQKLFGINFAMGVATGIILEFEFGTNWSNYSWLVGDIFGAPLAVEGILAFFMESTFVAVMFFGWKKVSAGFHLASTWLTGIGATLSAWWILVANSWMQSPVGHTFNPDTMRNELSSVSSFLDVAFSPAAVDKFSHTVTSSWIVGAVFVVAVSSYYLLKKREQKLAIASIKIAACVGIVASLLAGMTGHHSAQIVAKTQPMKLAAMEALYDGGKTQPLTAFSLINPFAQPQYKQCPKHPCTIDVPFALSFLATNNFNGFVPGINDIIKGYTTNEGVKEPSLAEKIERGKKAIVALPAYREAKKANDTAKAEAHLKVLNENMKYFGYGYIKSTDQVVPYIPVCFWSFRLMVGLGTFFILFFVVLLFMSYKQNLSKYKSLLFMGILSLPLGYIASEAGWIVAEMGRQPWTIQDMLPTWIAVSNLNASSVIITFFLFLLFFTAMLITEINILCKQIKKGPEYSSEENN